jgi:hypothetical protein
MRVFLIIFFSFLCGGFFSQTFEMGSGLFFFKTEGSVLQNNGTGTAYTKRTVDDKNYSAPGAAFNFYIPVYSKSTELSVGIFSGVSGFLKLKAGETSANKELYAYTQLRHSVSKASGFYVPLMVNLRTGRNATSNSVSKAGLGIGGGITLCGFNLDKYYFDKIFYAAPSMNAELSLGRTKFRFLYLIVPYKTYYIYDTGKKEKKYNISQFSVTMSITLGDD